MFQLNQKEKELLEKAIDKCKFVEPKGEGVVYKSCGSTCTGNCGASCQAACKSTFL